jgi:hypothetical protein
MQSFTVTDAPAEPVELEGDRGTFTVKVTNTSAQERVGTVLVVPQAPATLDWFAIAGEATRVYPAGKVEQVTITIEVPAGTIAATYAVQVDAKSETVPDEDYTDGPLVAFVVPEPRKPVPWWRRYWWVFAIALAIVVLGIVVAVVAG